MTRRCPHCGGILIPQENGVLNMKNPCSGRVKPVQVYRCQFCGYRTLD